MTDTQCHRQTDRQPGSFDVIRTCFTSSREENDSVARIRRKKPDLTRLNIQTLRLQTKYPEFSPLCT